MDKAERQEYDKCFQEREELKAELKRANEFKNSYEAFYHYWKKRNDEANSYIDELLTLMEGLDKGI
uniref:Uncharacterized protein n=1 Tax=viral metagenome TaxID=1070528 RepID=A0A6M3K6T9_9ZZZZ